MKSFFQRIHDNHPVGRKSAPKNKAEPEKTAQRTTALPPEPIESTLNRSHKHGHKRSSSRAPRPTADSLPQTSGRPLERRTQSNSNVNDPAVAAARTSPLLVSNSVLQSSAEPVPPKLPQENGSNTYPPRRSRRHNTQPNPALPPSDVRRPTMPLANKYEEHPLDQEPLHMVEPDARGKRKEQVGMWIQDERAEGKHIPPKAGKEPRSHVKEMGQDGAGKPQAGRRRRGSKERDEGRDERDYERNVKETRGHDRERGRSGGQDRYQYGDRHGDLDSLEPQRREKDIGADQISISQRDRIPESRIGDVVPERTAQQGVELKGQREGGRNRGEEKERRRRREKEQGGNVARDAQRIGRDRGGHRSQEPERRVKEAEEQEQWARQHEQRERERGERRAREQRERQQREKEQAEQREQRERSEKDKRERDRLEQEERERWEREQREREQQEAEQREREKREKEEREKEQQEKVKREREEQEQQEREQREREQREREAREKERRERERQDREAREKERRERKQREREQWEREQREAREKERLEKEREKEQRDIEKRELERQERERERENRERELQEREREYLEREQREKERREQREREQREKEKREEQERERERRAREKVEKEQQEKEQRENREREQQEMAQRERGRERKDQDIKRKGRTESKARRAVPPEDSSGILEVRRTRRPKGVRDDANPAGDSRPDDGEHKHLPRVRESPGTPHGNNAMEVEQPPGGIGFPTSHREGKFTPRSAGGLHDPKPLESGDSSDNSWRKPVLVSHRRYKTEEGTSSTPKHRVQPPTPLTVTPNLPQNPAELSINGLSSRHVPPGPPPKDGINPPPLAKGIETKQREYDQRPENPKPSATTRSAAQDDLSYANDIKPLPQIVEKVTESTLKGKGGLKHQDSPQTRFISAVGSDNVKSNSTMPQYPSAHAPLTNDAKSSPLESHILQSHDNLPGDDSLNITPIAFAKESSVQRESPGSRNRGWRAMDTRATALPPQMPEPLAKPVLNPTQTPSLKPITDFPSSSNTVKSNHQNHGPVAQYSKHGENQRDRSVLDDSSKRTTMHHARQMPPVQNSKLSATPLANPVPLSGSQIIPIHAKLASQSETHNMLEYDSTPRSNSSIPPLVHDDRAPNLNVSPTLDRAQNKSHPDQFPLSGSPRQPALPSVPNLVASYEVRTKTSGQPAGVVPGAVASPLIATRSGPGVYNEPREDWHSPRPRRLHRVDSNPPPPFIPRPPTAMDLNHGPHGSARFESNAAIPHTANMSGPAIPSVSIPRDKNFDNPVTNSNQWLSGPTARVADLPVAPVNNNVGMTIPRPSTAMDRRNDSSSKVPVQYPPHRATPATPTVINRDFEFPLKRPSTATGFRYEVGRDKGLPGPLIPSSLAENTNSNHHFNPPLIRPSISQPNERMSTHSPIISTQASKLHDILSDKPSPSRLAGNSVLSPIRAGANSFVDPHTLSNPDIQMTRTSSAQRPIDTSVNDAGNIPSRVLRQVSNQPERDGGHQSGNPSQALEKASESNPPEEPRGRVRSTPPSAIAPATPITKYSPYIMPSPADIHSPPFGTTLKGRQAPTTSPIHPSENNVFRPVIQHPQLLELLSSPTRIEHKTSQPYNLKPANTTHIPTMATPPNNKRPEDTSQDHPAAIGKLVNPSHALHTPPTPTPLAPPTAPQARHSPTLPTPPISNTMKDSQTHALSYYSPMYKAPDNSTAPTRGAPSYVPQTPNPTTQLLSKSREPSDPRIYRPVRPRETPANPGSQPLSSIDRAEPSTPHPQRSLSVDPSAPSADRRVYIQDAQDGGLLQGARSKGYNMHAPAMQTSSTLPPARYRTWQPEQRTHRPEPRAREGNTSASELPGSSAGRAAQLNGHTSSRNAHASTPAVTPLKALPPSQPLSKRPPPDNLVIASTRVPAPAPANSSRTAVDMARMISEDSTVDTPSSLTPPPTKRSTSRTSIPASMHSQEPHQKPSILSRLKPKTSQPDEPDSSHPYTVWHPPSSTRPRHRNDTSTGSLPDPKPISSLSSRVKVPPPINVPIPALPISERKSPNSKGFAAFRYLTTRRNRTMSGLSAEATDGATTNTAVSPTASMTSQPPIRRPSLRDPMRATQEWRNKEEQVLVGGKNRRKRPGVVFDVPEGAGEKPRTKLSSRPRVHDGPSRKK